MSDGCVIAFESGDDNIVPSDGNPDSDVFVRELAAGTAELVSVHDPSLPSVTPSGGISGVTAVFAQCQWPLHRVFQQRRQRLPNDTNGYRDVFVRDLMTGTDFPVSVNTNGVVGDSISTDPAISGNGRYVAFTSSANDLVANDTNNAQDVFVRDLQAGTTTLVSVSTDGIHPGNGDSFSPTISADGRYVLFYSKASNLAAGMFGSRYENLFLARPASRNHVCAHGEAVGGAVMASMTPDGRISPFVGAVPEEFRQLYVWNSTLAALIYTNNNSSFQNASVISISANGQEIAAATSSQLFAINVVSNTTWTIQSSGAFLSPFAGLQFSGDGHFLTYAMSTNVSLPANANVYLYDFQAGNNILISQNPNTLQPANGASDSPAISRRWPVYCLSQRGHRSGAGQHQWHSAVDCL